MGRSTWQYLELSEEFAPGTENRVLAARDEERERLVLVRRHLDLGLRLLHHGLNDLHRVLGSEATCRQLAPTLLHGNMEHLGHGRGGQDRLLVPVADGAAGLGRRGRLGDHRQRRKEVVVGGWSAGGGWRRS